MIFFRSDRFAPVSCVIFPSINLCRSATALKSWTTPLNQIIGQINILIKNKIPPPTQAYCDIKTQTNCDGTPKLRWDCASNIIHLFYCFFMSSCLHPTMHQRVTQKIRLLELLLLLHTKKAIRKIHKQILVRIRNFSYANLGAQNFLRIPSISSFSVERIRKF